MAPLSDFLPFALLASAARVASLLPIRLLRRSPSQPVAVVLPPESALTFYTCPLPALQLCAIDAALALA
eukprot:3007936-Pyramimonas_sp.AAC.1